MAPKIAIVFYSMYGHIKTLADAEKQGIEKAGGTADLFQIPETLSEEILAKMYAPAKSDVPVLSDPSVLEQYDAFLFGIPTRYGTFPAQWKAFWDSTGKQWASGGFWGKQAGVFVSTAGLGGGQESTALNAISTLTHHGISYVPFGYAKAFAQLTDLSEVHGGSPWGAGTFASSDGSRQPSAKDLEIAQIQGEEFYKLIASRVGGGNGAKAVDAKAAEVSAPAAAETKKETETTSQPQIKGSSKDKEGPCGLPAKCVIL